MRDAPSNACVGTDGKCQCLTQQGAAVGRGFLEGAAPLETVAPLGLNAFTPQESEGCVGNTLRRARHGPIGTAQALANHCGHGFAWRNHCLLIWHETCVDHGNQPSIFAHRSHHASGSETLDANLCHWTPLP
jgi:hypothetical protein